MHNIIIYGGIQAWYDSRVPLRVVSQDTVEEAQDDKKRTTALALENLMLQRARQ